MRVLALAIDWRNEDGDDIPQAEVSSYFRGEVTDASYSVGGDVLTLVYRDGRTVRIRLQQCKTHACDQTCMILEEDR